MKLSFLILALIVGGCTVRCVCEHEQPKTEFNRLMLPNVLPPDTGMMRVIFVPDSTDVYPSHWRPGGGDAVYYDEVRDENGIIWSRDVWLDRERLKRDRR